jgi:hypothetical protein
VETVEQPELLRRSPERIAGSREDALSQAQPDACVEITLQNPVIASRLIALVALSEEE